MGDYISREAAKQVLDWHLVGDVADTACKLIDTVPAADADGFCETLHVVRCMDCKHMYRDNVGVFCKVWNGYNGCGYDGFCNYGERKEKE